MDKIEAMLNLPKYINMQIEHQPHASSYESVDEWLGYNIHHRYVEPSESDVAEMLKTESIWVIHWYPDTPVRFCAVAAATLERALDLARGAK